MTKPRVLVIAEACNPEAASIPLESWALSRALGELTNVHLVTEIRTRDHITRAGLREGEDFTALDAQKLLGPVFRAGMILRSGSLKNWTTYTAKGWTTYTALSAFTYYYFEHLVWKTFGDAISSHEYDIVHRVTPLTPTTPSLLAAKCRRAGVPFVWGPINGGVPWPKGFAYARRKDREWLTFLRPAYKLMPGYMSTRRNASAIMVGSIDTWKQMPSRYRERCIYVPENAIDASRFGQMRHQKVRLPLRLAFVGRLVPFKGADMLLEAAAPLLREGHVVVDIIGDGPEMENLKSIVDRLELGTSVKLDGWVEHSQLQERLMESDVFAYPSIREFGGGVVVEAMALGLMPIVVGYAGPNELVSEATGHRIPIGTRQEIIERLRALLVQLVSDPSDISERGTKARERVLNLFTWPAKARQILEVYKWVTKQRADKPDFGMPLMDAPPSSD